MIRQRGWHEGSEEYESMNEPLIIHRIDDGESSGTLVIFVHGLGGNRYRTWGQFPVFLLKDVPYTDVGLYAYRTLTSRLKLAASIELDVEAIVLADTLRECLSYKRIILIGHSMGGLLCKAAIKELIDRDDLASLRRLGGLFLLATPQAGSGWVPFFLTWISKDMRALNPHGALIERVHRTFVDRISADIRSDKLFLPVFAVTATEDAWVSVLSSGLNIPSSNRKVVRGSHTRIVKPTSRDDDVYQWVLERIKHLTSLSENHDFKSTLRTEGSRNVPALAVPVFSRSYVEKKSEWKHMEGQTVCERYPLTALVGCGGTGAVFRSRELSLGRDVAVKIFYSVPYVFVDILNHSIARSVRGLAALSHRNLQRILDFGILGTASSGASLFVVSEFIDGVTLWKTLCEKELRSDSEAIADIEGFVDKVTLAMQLTAGLRAAHNAAFIGESGFAERGVCHGDLTPENVLIDQSGRAVLIDFMMPDIQKLIVKDDQRDARWQLANGQYSFHVFETEAYGTPGFMPPEQAAEGIVTPVSDIYTLGLTFAQLFFSDQYRSKHREPFLISWQLGWRLSRFLPSEVRPFCILIESLIESMTKIQPKDRLQDIQAVDESLAQIQNQVDEIASSIPKAAILSGFDDF